MSEYSQIWLLNRDWDPFLLKSFLEEILFSGPPSIAGVVGSDFLLSDFSFDYNLNFEEDRAISEVLSSFFS